ncbi:DUF4258 domain-containing protein, partial [Burkholderia gladioli]
CAASAAEGSGCSGGAIGGAVSAGINPIIDANGNIPPAVLTAIETLVSGSVAGSLGFNVQGAVTAAQNETLNNWLNHVTVLPGQQSQAQQLQSAMAACDSGNSSACATVATLMQTSSANDQALATACKSPGSLACAYQESRAYLAGNNISVVNGVTAAPDAQQPAYTAPSQAAATLDNMLGSPLAGIFGGLMYAAGASPTDAYYASVIGQATEGIAAGAAGFTMPSAPTNGSSASTSRATNSEATSPVGVSGSPMTVPRGTNVPATINGVDYSAHAIDQMQGRGIPPSVVQNTIQNGAVYPTGAGTTGYYDPVNNVRVITNSTNGRVVTVIPGAPGK